MTDKQEPDIVERLRKYPADPTMCDDYSAAMLDAADEIERLREQMSMMAQYGKPPAQLADIGNTISSKTPEPNEENPYVLWREIHRLRTEVQGPSGFATWQDAAVAERVRRVKAEQELRAAQPAPLRDPLVAIRWRPGEEPCGECHLQADEVCDICGASQPAPAQEPVIGKIIRVLYEASHGDFEATGTEAMAVYRAIEAAIVPPGYVVVPVQSLRRWRDAFAEELAGYDIDPPIHHVKTSHDEINTVIAAAPKVSIGSEPS